MTQEVLKEQTMKLIDKDAIVSEIERYKHKADMRLKIKGRTLAEDVKDSALQNLCGNLLYFINTIQVKEVDLEEEISNYLTSYHLHIKDGGRIVFDNDDSPNFNIIRK